MNNNKIMKLFLIIVSVIGVVEMGVIPTSHLSTYNETMETTIIQILLPNNDVLNIQLKLYLFKKSSLANINNIDELESKLKTSQATTMASYITEERKLKKDEDDEAPQETTTTTTTETTTTETTTTETTTTETTTTETTTTETTTTETTTTETTTTETTTTETTTTETTTTETTTTEASSSSTEASSSSTEATESSSSTPQPANFQIYDEYDDLSSPSKQSFTPLNEEDGNNDNVSEESKILNKTEKRSVEKKYSFLKKELLEKFKSDLLERENREGGTIVTGNRGFDRYYKLGYKDLFTLRIQCHYVSKRLKKHSHLDMYKIQINCVEIDEELFYYPLLPKTIDLPPPPKISKREVITIEELDLSGIDSDGGKLCLLECSELLNRNNFYMN
ncbi:uncharacterized protein [Drosophila takahashii]|uniref:uncharacterized protein isoform X1 n=1 Tax=Drosophila takahashii TaxID=29030 RepID=UPI0038990128